MSTLFRNKYRIESTRLPGYDYGSPGWYFITICTKNREYYFGHIQNQKMIHSEIGIIAEKFWREIPDHFPHAAIDEFVIMPNHLHGIIHIRGENINNGNNDGKIVFVETQHAASLQSVSQQPPDIMQSASEQKPDSIQPGSIPAIIRSFKSAVKKRATMNKIEFSWQPRYHDHIIRDENSLHRIRKYIIENPQNWAADDFNNGIGVIDEMYLENPGNQKPKDVQHKD